jgi:hypothetical protein
MSVTRRCFLVGALWITALAPVLTLPRLAPHVLTLQADRPAVPRAPGWPDGALYLAPLAGITIRKDAGSIAKKFSTRAAAASGDYKDGVAGAGQDWQTQALAGAKNYEQGLVESIADHRFEKGVQAAGAAKYQQNATTLGPQRFSQGVANAEGAYQKGVAPHLEGMRSLQLPPRGPKGSEANKQRQNITATRNREIKLGK